jgi:hypothetical protein
MAVRVDEPRDDRGPLGVDDGVRVAVEPAADRRDPAIGDGDRVGVEQRSPDVAGCELPDVS